MILSGEVGIDKNKLGNLSDSFSGLPKIRSGADRAKLNAELRPLIDELEDLYRQLL